MEMAVVDEDGVAGSVVDDDDDDAADGVAGSAAVAVALRSVEHAAITSAVIASRSRTLRGLLLVGMSM